MFCTPLCCGRWGRRLRGLGGPRPVVFRRRVQRGVDASLIIGVVVAVGGRRGEGGREACGIPGRGEEDEYQDRKVQGRLDETQRGREERRAVAVASGPETSFILTSHPQNCSRHPATRITLDTCPPQLLCHLLPSTSWGSLHIHIVGPGNNGHVGWLGGGRRVLLLSLSSY